MCHLQTCSRTILESGLESIFAGLGLGHELGSFFSKFFFKSTSKVHLWSVRRVFSRGGLSDLVFLK